MILNSDMCNEEFLTGAYVSCRPLSNFLISTQVCKAWEGKISRGGGRDCNTALINSISADVSGFNQTAHAEVGKNWERDTSAYTFSTQGMFRGIYYGFGKEHCPEHYQYCFNGSDSMTANTNFPMFLGLRGSFSYWGVRNYPRQEQREFFRENKVFLATVTCPPRAWFTNFTFQHQTLEDNCSRFSNVVDTGTLGASGFIRCVHYYLGATIGRFSNGNCCAPVPLWHQYNLNLSCCLRRCWSGTFNMAIGPITGYCFDEFRKRAGFRLSWRGNQRFRFEAGFNYWWFRRFDGQASGSLKTAFFFRNGNTFELESAVKWLPGSCNYFYYTSFNYSIPWSLNGGRKCSKSALKGNLIDERGAPLPYQRVNCGPNKTLTDAKGQFAFPNIAPGEYTLFVNPDADGYVLANKEALTQSLEGGYEKSVSLVMVRSCSLRGKVALFGFEETGESVEEKALSTKGFKEGISFKELRGIEGAAVYIRSKARNETHRLLTDRDGEFSFTQLPPGDWQIEVEFKGMPLHHEMVLSEDVVTLSPNETNDVHIDVVPKKRKIQML